jgi:hypothetical protein
MGIPIESACWRLWACSEALASYRRLKVGGFKARFLPNAREHCWPYFIIVIVMEREE